MARRSCLGVALFALSLLTAGTATAQTADGVGDPGTGRRAADAEDAARSVAALADYERKFFQLTLRTWAIGVPGFVLNGFFDAHEGHWRDGVYNFNHGLEFTTRIPDKYDVVVGVDWASLRTPDGYWLESGDPIIDANWAENNLSLLTFDVGFQWFKNLNRQDTLQLYYGVGLGASVVLGEFRKYDLIAADCGQEFVDNRESSRVALLDNCFDANGDPTIIDDYQLEKIPPILPAISATLGLRTLVADSVSIGIEGGLKSLYFYGGIEIGYFWESQPRTR